MIEKVAFKFDPNSTKCEGRWRLIDPKEFDSKSYRRWTKWGKKKLPKGVTIVVGQHKKEDRMLPQTIRFKLDSEDCDGEWTESKAREWWNKSGKKLFGKYKSWTAKDWKKQSSITFSLYKIARLLVADYPGHPDKKVVRKNEFYENGLTEDDIWQYYDRNKNKILPYLKNSPEVLIRIKTDQGIIVKRNDSDGKPIQIKSITDFDKYNNGRNMEFHIVSKPKTKIGWVDLDPGKNFEFTSVQKVAKELKTKLIKLSFIKSVMLKYSGGRGFHLLLDFTREMDVDDARQALKDFLESYIEDTSIEKLVLKTPKPSEMRLDISTLHDKGSIRAPYSLNADTGLISLPNVMEKEKAKI